MPGTLDLRPTPYDHPDAVAMTALAQTYYRSVYGGEDSNPIDAAEFRPPQGQFLVGYLDGEPVAMGGWRLFEGTSPVPANRPGEVRRMFVDPVRRRLGLGRQLLAALEASALAAGVDVLLLETGSPQADAIALYRSAGYVDVPDFGYWAGGELSVPLGRRLLPRAG